MRLSALSVGWRPRPTAPAGLSRGHGGPERYPGGLLLVPGAPGRIPPGHPARAGPSSLWLSAGGGRSARPLSRKLEGRSRWLKREFLRGVWARARDALSAEVPAPPFPTRPHSSCAFEPAALRKFDAVCRFCEPRL